MARVPPEPLESWESERLPGGGNMGGGGQVVSELLQEPSMKARASTTSTLSAASTLFCLDHPCASPVPFSQIYCPASAVKTMVVAPQSIGGRITRLGNKETDEQHIGCAHLETTGPD